MDAMGGIISGTFAAILLFLIIVKGGGGGDSSPIMTISKSITQVFVNAVAALQGRG